ncbi:hypothetical protein HRbin18_01009 [bacterium HR18]|nr:hypothetical protein HRbin18_01009 [bacterium HR18]
MRSLLTYTSSLLGAFVLFWQLWKFVPLERALLSAATAAVGSYLVLLGGYLTVRWILQQTLTAKPTKDQQGTLPDGDSETSAKTAAPTASRTPTPAAA